MSDLKSLEEIFGPVISSYTDEQALEDGVFVKTNDRVVPMMTRTVFVECIDQFVMKDEKGAWVPGTPTPESLMRKLLASVKEAVRQQVAKGSRETLYKVDARGWTFFVALNAGGWTLLFPEDY